MILSLFLLFIFISLVLIIIGIFRPEHSEQAMVGFGLLFILGITLINGSITYPVGDNTTISNTYSIYNESVVLSSSIETKEITYSDFQDSSSHTFGYWISIVSAFGLFGVIIGFRRGRKEEE